MLFRSGLPEVAQEVDLPTTRSAGENIRSLKGGQEDRTGDLPPDAVSGLEELLDDVTGNVARRASDLQDS